MSGKITFNKLSFFLKLSFDCHRYLKIYDFDDGKLRSFVRHKSLISTEIIFSGIREFQRLPNSGPENHPVLPGEGNPNLQEELGIINHTGPVHPSYATPDARMRSFKEWPPGLKVQPNELVDAGRITHPLKGSE